MKTSKIALTTLIIFTLLLSFSTLTAEVLDSFNLSSTDEFTNLAGRISNNGIIYVVLNDGEPAIETYFHSSQPPSVFINLYKDYIKSKGAKLSMYLEKFLESDHTWTWSGEINNENKYIQIYSEPGGNKTTIKAVSFKKDPSFLKHFNSLVDTHPELKSIGNGLISSREVLQGERSSGFFLFSTPGNPETVLRKVRQNFQRTGWKDILGGPSNNNSINLSFMNKGMYTATFCASRDEGETTLLVTIAHAATKP